MKDPPALRLVPLGGLGEIGMNCLALEQDGAVLLVDCGTTFPADDHGIDVIHPSFEWLKTRAEQVAGVFITHGHEDHIGALPYLLRDLDVPVWGPAHALASAWRRLEEHGFSRDDVTAVSTTPGRTYHVGPFTVEPIRVSHSIVEATALAIRTACGTVVHTGDFKLDPSPLDGEPTDEARLGQLGDEGVALLLSDSTNVDSPGHAGSESTVADELERLVEAAPERVVISLFASNVQRLIAIGRVAKKTRRRICLLGRSLVAQHDIATRLGHLDWPSGLLIAPEDVAGMPRRDVLVLAGGTQGEPRASLTRIARREHGRVTLERGDTVILSSRIIPGNDRPVFDVISNLLRQGVTLHTRVTDPAVHVSGHAHRGDQERMIELLRPRAFLPVHGTLHHLLRHAELARDLGVESVLAVENGTAVRFDGARLARDGTVPHGRVSIAQGGETLGPGELVERTDLGRAGIAVVSVVLRGGDIDAGPLVTTRGVPGVDGDAGAHRAVALEIARAWGRHRSRRASGDLIDVMRKAARRELERLSRTTPVVEVHVIDEG